MIYESLIEKKESLSVIGLGYVGMPIAVAFAKKIKVIGFDLNRSKIDLYNMGVDPTLEVGNDVIKSCGVHFTSNEKELSKSLFHIVAVPTPINQDKTPDLAPVIGATKIIGRNLKKGAIIVYESTVYPGVTEDICVPLLEKESGMKCGIDFKVGYSPERINPGDKIHRLDNIIKIVSGMDDDSLNEISKIYNLVVQVGVYKASSIRVAEAAKVVENSQRDINIAFMNELAIVFDKMGIDTNEVVDAMNTKWNALGFRAGLVGGHCIGVDPYYFVYKAENLGYHSQIVASGRKVNDSIGGFIADAIIKKMILTNKVVRKSKVVIFGITFKENCPDIRNSKVNDIILRLNEYGIIPEIVDPWANEEEVLQEYNVKLKPIDSIRDVDVLVFAVAHKQFEEISFEDIDKMYKKTENNEKVLIDVKGNFNIKDLESAKYSYWRL